MGTSIPRTLLEPPDESDGESRDEVGDKVNSDDEIRPYPPEIIMAVPPVVVERYDKWTPWTTTNC